ncbi:class I SAM-dependent rRNA methyltransferase [Longibaculum muris]|uniref:SAM-dependent methyltransferase n=1 Tax=Longibaculum muris TaxID=1796628 RepID=A0A4R3YYY1_9FIRM|nr:class I SAM-dependent rRNA methyltransferase [Longibaculum muris]KXU52244.1 putative 23S rRNA methyltransferase [Candidatus Stoquefichus sp. KLE1796]MBS5370503.1 class I SAM-dependent rRNA methyltransferase [Coprobacillus cateniformis]MCR1887444.1 class I SAM-dependent rRNA methyltransferase [Longibaculum muris]TCV97870.1 SAM-dependent methyltransferase [Longibaculum muris]
MKRNYPKVVISKEGEQWLDKGQMWMYRNNLESMDEDIENGALVDIETRQGRYLGTGFLSKNSHITVRILSKDLNDTFDRKFFKQRIQFAYQFRKTLEADNITNCRLIFGEADQLPGLTVDRYNDILVTQISSYGLEMIKDMIYKLLLEVLSEDGQDVKGIYERNDIKVRSKEGLPLEKGYWKNAQLPTKTVINENGLKLNVDVENGQKTGYFLDQKSNRVLLRNMSHGKRVLDCFSHTGGFALNAAFGNASEVVAVDVSQTALDQGYANAKLNHLEDKITFVKDDVFDYLDKCEEGRFDIIVLDPPAFTKSRRTIDHAYNGYKKINMKAMKLLGRGGYLITCSCSRFMETDNFEKMLRESAHEVGVTLKQVSVTQQNHDYPILWTMEETSYLKFYIFQII